MDFYFGCLPMMIIFCVFLLGAFGAFDRDTDRRQHSSASDAARRASASTDDIASVQSYEDPDRPVSPNSGSYEEDNPDLLDYSDPENNQSRQYDEYAYHDDYDYYDNGSYSGSHSYETPGEVWVDSYVRSDGTPVQGHYRTAPNSTTHDNWSTLGNRNPHTGEYGTRYGY